MSQVQRGSPAEKAGLRAGDVVVRVAGKPAKDSREVQRLVLEQKIGSTVEVVVWRSGKEIKFDVRTAELPNDDAEPGAGPAPGRGELGLALQTLTPELAQRLGVRGTSSGAVVGSVRPGSPAAEAGIRERDVIAEIDRKPVTTAEDAAKRLAEPNDRGHLVLLFRDGSSIFVVLRGTPRG